MEASSEKVNRLGQIILAVVGLITTLGVVMVYSSSYMLGKEHYGSSSHFLNRQIMFLLFGLALFWITSKTRFNFWIKYGLYINSFAVIAVLLTYFPSIGVEVKGAHRWVAIGSLKFQPAEIVKFTILLAAYPLFDHFSMLSIQRRLLLSLSILFPMGLILMQPDFGSFTICFLVLAGLCFFSTFPRKYFYWALGIGLTAGIPLMLSQPYRVQRLFSFLDPWKNPKTSGFQIIQSYLAFANGSLFGQGIGNSNEKLFYLPEAHNDFIFSVIGEELGFVGVLFTILLFMTLLTFGFKLASSFKTRRHALVVAAVFFTIGLQAMVNMGVVLGLLPTKGLNLPFISSGGSSMIMNFFALGLVFSAIKEHNYLERMGPSMGLKSNETRNYLNRPSFSTGAHSKKTI